MTSEKQEHIKTTGEQMDSASFSIYLFSSVNHNDEAINIPGIVGQEKITDQVTIDGIEEGLGQLNIVEIYGISHYYMRLAEFQSERLDNPEMVTPTIWHMKSRFEKTYMIEFLVAAFSDLKIQEVQKEIDYCSKMYNGAFRRTEKQLNDKTISSAEQLDECYTKATILGNYLYDHVFREREAMGATLEQKRGARLACGFVVKGEIINNENQCLGSCGRTFFEDEDYDSINHCDGEVIMAPPTVALKEIASLYPSLSKSTVLEEELDPIHFFQFWFSTLFPRRLGLSMNRVNEEIIQNLFIYPQRAVFQSKEKPEESLEVFTKTVIKGKEITFFVALTSTEINDRDDLPDQISVLNISRDVIDDLKGGVSPKEAISNQKNLEHWNLSEFMNMENLQAFQSFSEMNTKSVQTDQGE
ncbi:MAG: hypothetical protein ACTSYA_03010 [Candidatus Kariarchaeaceae archaeon]